MALPLTKPDSSAWGPSIHFPSAAARFLLKNRGCSTQTCYFQYRLFTTNSKTLAVLLLPEMHGSARYVQQSCCTLSPLWACKDTVRVHRAFAVYWQRSNVRGSGNRIRSEAHLCKGACCRLWRVLHPLCHVGDTTQIYSGAVEKCDIGGGHDEHAICCWPQPC